jgi:hypothetical protein
MSSYYYLLETHTWSYQKLPSGAGHRTDLHPLLKTCMLSLYERWLIQH